VKLEDELEMMARLHREPRFSLRLWVVGTPDDTTYGNVDWVVAPSNGISSHSAKLGRFTWNGQLDVPMRAIICAREMISQVYDKLPPIGVR
jgi:hypothetical protein